MFGEFSEIKVRGFTAGIFGNGIYLVAHISVTGGWLFPDGTTFREAAYCLN